MKKLLLTVMALLMSVSMVACSSNSSTGTTTSTEGEATTDGGYTGPTEYVEATSREVQTMDYVITALAEDHELNANFVDGLLENDRYGTFVGAIAESWESNEDATVWTFHIKPGVQWVTYTGDVYDEVKAEDFVTGLRHGAEFDSGTAWLLQGVVKGYLEYMTAGDFSDEAFANVGVEATDDYTLVYTLEAPTPYFYTMTTYSVLYPVNREFLESKGTGCALGAPDKENCAFGTASADSILYNGAYIMSVFDAKSQTVLTKNENYWDAEHVYINKITRIYDDGSDPYSIIKGFEQGTYATAGLNTSWADYDAYAEKYADNAYPDLANAYAFGVVFNYNRQTYENTAHTTDEDKTNTYNAIQNENFRKALRAAYDKKAYLATTAPEAVAEATLRNINNYPEVVKNSEGVIYGDLVTAAYDAATGTDVDLSDGHDAFFDPEAVQGYIDAAAAEGINFPVHLDMLVIETSDRLLKQSQSMKQSVEENSNGQIIIDLILRDEDTVQNIAYYNTDPALADYDISTFTGWGPDYADPKSFVDIYSPVTGYYMTSCGLTTTDEDRDIKEALGLYEYEDLYRAADAITDDMDARYDAFAKADSYLIEHALYIPTSQQARSLVVSRIVPFSKVFSRTGITEYKYKGLQLQEDIVTLEQYNAAKAEWEANR